MGVSFRNATAQLAAIIAVSWSHKVPQVGARNVEIPTAQLNVGAEALNEGCKVEHYQ